MTYRRIWWFRRSHQILWSTLLTELVSFSIQLLHTSLASPPPTRIGGEGLVLNIHFKYIQLKGSQNDSNTFQIHTTDRGSENDLNNSLIINDVTENPK